MVGGPRRTRRKLAGRWATVAEHGDDPMHDATEAAELFDVLERDVIPEFYERNADGIPTAWVARMRASMSQLTPRFSSNRAVCEYTERFYLPAAATYTARAADGGGRQSNRPVAPKTERVVGRVALRRRQNETRSDEHLFEVQLYLGRLEPDAVCVELYSNGAGAGGAARQPMRRLRELSDAPGSYVYGAAVSERGRLRTVRGARGAVPRRCGSAARSAAHFVAAVRRGADSSASNRTCESSVEITR